MRSDSYQHLFTAQYMMGPNSIRLLDELTSRYPLAQGGRILDLGCGAGLTSLFAAREFGCTVYATDLWISATDNYRRFETWNATQRIIPLHASAHDLPYADEFFDAIISVDAYHYFACEPAFFQQKILPLVKPGGWILIAVPGLKEEFQGEVPPAFFDWCGDEHTLFHSCDWWRRTIGESPIIDQVHFWPMDIHDLAWQEWYASGHEYALNDKTHLDHGAGQYLTTVGMAIRRTA